MSLQLRQACSQIPLRPTARPFLLQVVALLIVCALGSPAQAPPQSDIDTRSQALELCKERRFTEALPLLEKSTAAYPGDFVVWEMLGQALVNEAGSAPDPAARKQMLLRARSAFVRARDLGDKSDYLATMLEQLPENGDVGPFSTRKEVDDAMQEGEAAFSRNDYSAALAAYQRALDLDPKAYHAALFTGDVYFRMNQMDKAADWFAKAIAIDPDRETAYRYWGDALLKDGKMDEAKAKFIEAVVCEPYQHASWNGLHNWLRANHAAISHPQVESPDSVSGEGKNINITIGAGSLGKNDGSEAWLAYDVTRASWRGERFKKQFPNEPTYRHSLAEEADALNAAASVLVEGYKKPKQRKRLQPALLTLLELKEKDMIEPFVLLSKPDTGITKDYVAYRAEHADKLREYISEWLIKPAPDSK